MINSSTPRSGTESGVVRDEQDDENKQQFEERQQQYGNILKSYADGYEGYDSSYFLNKLRTDEKLLDEVSGGIYQNRMKKIDEDTFLDERDLTRDKALQKTKNNVRSLLNEEMYSGEEVSTSISKHLKKLRTSQKLPPVNGMKQIMENNPDKYGGFVSDNGEVEMGQQALVDSVNNNEDLFQSVVNDKIEDFESQLSKSHNQGVINPETDATNPEEYSKAFMVYDRYGKEGLSDYMNILQHYDPNQEYEEQSTSVQNALDFFNAKDANGKKPIEYVEESVEGIEFDPIELKETRPADHNDYTAMWYDQDVNPNKKFHAGESEVNAFREMVGEVMDPKSFKRSGEDEEWYETVWNAFYDPTGMKSQKSGTEGVFDMVRSFFPSSMEMQPTDAEVAENLGQQSEIGPKTLFNHIADGGELKENDYYNKFLRLKSKQLQDPDQEGKYGVKDLFSTIQVYAQENGGRRVNDSGDPEYGIDYKNAPLHVKNALNLLTYRSGLNTFMRKEGDEYILEPNRPQRLQDQSREELSSWYFQTKDEEVSGDSGQVPQKVLDNNYLSGWLNTPFLMWETGERFLQGELGRIAMSSAQRLMQGAETIKNGILNGEWESHGELSETVDKMYEWTREESFENYSQFSDSNLHSVIDYGSNFVYYMAMLKKMGRIGNKQLSKGINQGVLNRMAQEDLNFISSVRTSKNLSQVAKLLKGPKNKIGAKAYSRSQLQMRKLAQGLKKGSEPVSWADYTTGAAMYEFGNRVIDKNYNDNYSLMGSGIVDMGLDAVGIDSDVEGWFKSLENDWGGKMTQFGLSVLADETLGVFMDTLLGAGRFAKNGAYKLRGKEFDGLSYKNGQFEKTDKMGEAFAPDYRRLFRFLQDGLDEIPRHDLDKSMQSAGSQIGKVASDIKDVDDVAEYYTNAIRPLVTDLKDQIRSTITEYHKTFGKGDLEDAKIDGIAEAMHQNFWRKVAKGMGEMASPKKYDEITSALKQLDDAEVSKVKDESGAEFMDKATASRIADQDPNYRVQEREVEGNTAYEVLDVGPNKWIVDFTTQLRAEAESKQAQKELGKFLDSPRSGHFEDDDVARTFFHSNFGKSYNVDGEAFVVKGMREDHFIAESLSGKTREIPFKEVEKNTKASGGPKGEKGDDTTSKSSDSDSIGIAEAKGRRDDGKAYLKDNTEKYGEYDLSTPTNRKETRQKLTDELEKLEDSPEEAQRINNALDLIKSREELGRHETVQGKRIRGMDEAGVKKQHHEARQWMKSEGKEVDYSNPDDINRAIRELNEEMNEVGKSRDFAENRAEKEGAEERAKNLSKALVMLQNQKAQMKKGQTRLNNLSDTQKKWLEGEDGPINVWDRGQVESRLKYLRQHQNSPKLASSIEGYNSQRVKGVVSFLEKQLQTIKDGGDPDYQTKHADALNEKKAQDIRRERKEHLKRQNDALAERLDTIDKQLEEGGRKKYKRRVNNAKKKDETLEESGVQDTYAKSTGLKKEGKPDAEEVKITAQTVGGSRATDFTTLNKKNGKKRPVRKWDYSKDGENGRIYYTQNNDGSIDHFVVNAKPIHSKGGVDDTVAPTRFMEIDGELRLNPYYRFISPNKLSKNNGGVQSVKVADIDDPYPNLDGHVIRVDETGNKVANVQRPLNEVENATKEKMQDGNYDAIEFQRNGQKYYKLVSRDQLLEHSQVGNKSLLDTSKIETVSESPSYKSNGANPSKTYDSEGAKVADDLKEAGVTNGSALKKIENADFHEPVKTHKKKLEPTWKDEGLDAKVKNKGKDDIIVDGDIKSRTIRKDDGGHYVLSNGQKAYVSRPREGSLLRVDDWVEKGKVRDTDFRVEEGEISKSDLEKGDLFSIKRGDHLRNGEVLDIEEDGTIRYSLYDADGKTKNRYEIGPEEADQYQLHKPFSMALAGGGILTLAEKFNASEADLENADQSFMSTWLLAGLVGALANKGFMKYAPKSYKRVSRWKKGFVEGTQSRFQRAEAQKTIEWNGKNMKVQEAKELGYFAEPDARFGEGAFRSLAETMSHDGSPKDMVDSLLRNKYMQSTWSFAQNSDSKTIKHIVNTLSNVQKDIDKQKHAFKREFNEKYGTNAFTKFFDERPMDILGKFTDSKKSTTTQKEQAYEQLNLGIWRLMNQELQFNRDGTASISKTDDWLNKYYDETPSNLREIDEILLNDRQTVDLMKSMRNQFQEVEKRFKEGLTQKEIDAGRGVYLEKKNRTIKHNGIKQEFSEAQYKTLVDDFVTHFNGTWKEYTKLHDNQPFVKSMLQKAIKKDDSVQDLNDIRNMSTQFTDNLREMYFPQMVSNKKINNMRQSFINNPKYKNKKEALNAFEEKLREDFVKFNEEEGGRFTEYDENRRKMVDKTFSDPTDAIGYLNRLLADAPDSAKRQFYHKFGQLSESGTGARQEAIERFKKQGILTSKVEEKEFGNGRKVTKTKWHLDPEKLNFKFKSDKGIEKFDLEKFANGPQVKKFYDRMLMGNVVKNSKFLENPRKYNLPPQYIETDIQKAIDVYGQDVGFRLKMLDEGIVNKTSLEKNWFGPAREELTQSFKQKGHLDPKAKVGEHMKRVRTAYNTMSGVVPEIMNADNKKQAFKKLQRKRQASEMFRNFMYASFSPSIAMLDTAQTFITTAPMTSFGSTLKGHKKATVGYKSLENFVENSREYGIVSRTLEDVSSDFLEAPKHQGQVNTWKDKAWNNAHSGMRKWQKLWTQQISSIGVPRKWLGTNLITGNGITRLGVDNIVGKNEINLTVNWVAHLTEARDMSKKWAKIQSGEGVRGLSKGDVIEKFELMGISSKDIDYFSKNANKLDDALNRVENEGGRITDGMDEEFRSMVEDIMYVATESYHGRNKLMRPEMWHNDIAKMMVTFNNFTYNQAVQLSQRRFLRPLNEWTKKYPETSDSKLINVKDLMVGKTLSPKKRNKYFRKKGLSQEAIDNMPLRVVSTLGRVLAGSGINSVLRWGMTTVRSFLTLGITEELLGFETDANDKLEKVGIDGGGFEAGEIVLNERAYKADQIELGDIKDPRTKKDFSKLVNYNLALTDRVINEGLDIGLGGPFLGGLLRYQSTMPAGVSMGDRMLQDIQSAVSGVASGDYLTAENLPRFAYNIGTTFIPPMNLLEDAKYEDPD